MFCFLASASIAARSRDSSLREMMSPLTLQMISSTTVTSAAGKMAHAANPAKTFRYRMVRLYPSEPCGTDGCGEFPGTGIIEAYEEIVLGPSALCLNCFSPCSELPRRPRPQDL